MKSTVVRKSVGVVFAQCRVGGDINLADCDSVSDAFNSFFPAAFGVGHFVVHFGFVRFKGDLDEV